jgi:hypothetical protein
MRLLAALALMTAPAAALAAEVTSASPDASALVIYRDSGGVRATEGSGDGVALVIESRTVDLPAGPSTIRFRGVADTIVPHTAVVEGLPGAVSERNFDYDLLSPAALVAKAVGERVRLVRTMPGSGRVEERAGVIRSAPEGVLIETDEGVEAYKCAGLPERLVFDRAPPGLSDRPTLSMQVDVPAAGRYTLRLGYLAAAFNWSADYVVTLAADGSSLDLHGWLTLANQTQTSFPASPTQVVAGTLSRSDDTRPVEVRAQRLSANCWPTATWAQMMQEAPMVRARVAAAPPPLAVPQAARLEEIVVTGAKTAVQSDLGDYKLYSLAEPTAVAARQIKQVAFLEPATAAFDRIYRFRGDVIDGQDGTTDAPEGALILRFQNARAAGLGVALPAGRVSVMQARAGAGRLFVGEQEISDTPVGLPVEMAMGASREVHATASVALSRQGTRQRRAKTLTFRNVRPTPVEVEVRESVMQSGFRLVTEDRAHANRASDLVWTVKLAAGASADLRYTIETD